MMYDRSLRIFAVLFLVSMMLSAQDVSITDFRIPESQYKRLSLGLTGNLNGYSQGGSPSYNVLENVLNAGFNVDHTFRMNSEDRSYIAHFFVGTGFRNSTTRQNTDYSSPQNSENKDKNEFLSINYNVSHSSYITPDELFWYGASQGNGMQTLNRQQSTSTTNPVSLSFNKQQNISVTIGAGAGYGKVRDARSVVTILRILEVLTEEGFLTRTLSNTEIIALAESYEQILINSKEHDRPAKYITKIIFDDLNGKGLITTEKIIAYSVMRSSEVFSEQVFSRVFGWTVQTGFEFHQTESKYSGNSFYTDYVITKGHHWVIEGQYGYPLTVQLHFNASATVSFPVISDQKRVGASLAGSVTYEIGNRIAASWTSMYGKNSSHITNQFGSAYIRSSDFIQSSLQFDYFLEDNISLNIIGAYNEFLTRSFSNGYNSRFVDDTYSITFGLNYRIF